MDKEHYTIQTEKLKTKENGLMMKLLLNDLCNKLLSLFIINNQWLKPLLLNKCM